MLSFPMATRYTKVAITLHWLIAALIIGQLIGGKVMMALDGSALKFELFQLHKSFGIIILLLSVARLIWRLTHKAPPLPDHMPSHERLAAKISHIGFYGLMIGIPMAGWAMVSAAPVTITTKIFKVIKWPDLPFIERSEGLHKFFENAHEMMSTLIIVLLIIHIGAALKHHFKDKDDVMTRMVPRLRPRR